jgi:hypothetical protein
VDKRNNWYSIVQPLASRTRAGANAFASVKDQLEALACPVFWKNFELDDH